MFGIVYAHARGDLTSVNDALASYRGERGLDIENAPRIALPYDQLTASDAKDFIVKGHPRDISGLSNFRGIDILGVVDILTLVLTFRSSLGRKGDYTSIIELHQLPPNRVIELIEQLKYDPWSWAENNQNSSIATIAEKHAGRKKILGIPVGERRVILPDDQPSCIATVNDEQRHTFPVYQYYVIA